MPTKYRKRLHRYLPISMPNGMKSLSNTPAIYCNADGSWVRGGNWMGSYRGRAGRPDCNVLVVRDSDGKFIDCKPFLHDFVSRDKWEDKDLYNFALRNTQTNVALEQGFIPGSVESKEAWYESMLCPGDMPELWDQNHVRLMAAKVHAEFIRFCKQYSHAKIALFPMVKSQKGINEVRDQDHFGWASYGYINRHVLARGERDKPVIYHLPEIVLYWVETDGHYRNIRVAIPPFGCKLLERGVTSAFSETFRYGPGSNGYTQAMKEGLPLQTVFHTLRYKNAGVSPSVGVNSEGYGRRASDERDGQIAYWPLERDLVAVRDASLKELDTYAMSRGGYAMRPSEILSALKEQELMDSLPLC